MKNFAEEISRLNRRMDAMEQDKGATLRFANVTGIEKGHIRVQLADGQNVVTAPLPTLQRRVLKDQEIKLPDIGEPVAVLFSGKGLENGVILGAIYSPNIPNPKKENHMEYSKFSDGTETEYDRKKHKLNANIQGDIKAFVLKSIDVDVDEKIEAMAKKEIIIESDTSITLKVGASSIVMTPKSITMQSPRIDIN